MNIGDKVKWVPNIDHHLELLPASWGQGSIYSWEHTIVRRGKDEVLSTDEIGKMIRMSQKGRRNLMENVKASKPQCTYPATVTAVEDNAVSLDITSPVGGVTLHYDNVSIDPSGKPGTCHQ